MNQFGTFNALSGLLTVTMLFCAGNLVVADNPASDEKLKSLIKSVAQQEAIYANCEMVVAYRYQLLRPASFRGLTLSRQENLRIIRQGEFQYVSRVIKGFLVDGTPIDSRRVSAFDGKQTRVKQDENETVHQGLKRYARSVRLHTFLLPTSVQRQQSLSEYLRQTEVGRIAVSIVTVRQNEIIDGLDCMKVEVATRSIGRETQTIRYIWLAPERNYIPVKSVVYFSNGKLADESTVLDWQEVKPGVWIPAKMEIIVNYIDDQGKLARSNRTEYRVEKIDLKPDYPVEFFRDVKLPEWPTKEKTAEGPKR